MTYISSLYVHSPYALYIHKELHPHICTRQNNNMSAAKSYWIKENPHIELMVSLVYQLMIETFRCQENDRIHIFNILIDI